MQLFRERAQRFLRIYFPFIYSHKKKKFNSSQSTVSRFLPLLPFNMFNLVVSTHQKAAHKENILLSIETSEAESWPAQGMRELPFMPSVLQGQAPNICPLGMVWGHLGNLWVMFVSEM